jgi:hypothetical protein
MLAGILHQVGYYMGERLYTAGIDSNPKGFFESKEINRINEAILSRYGEAPSFPFVNRFFRLSGRVLPGRNQRWLSSIRPSVDITNDDQEISGRISEAVSKSPFCYKDPRFSYTLPVWRGFLKPGTRFLCIFRRPDITVSSILKECRDREYLSDLPMTEKSAYDVWINMYSHILSKNAGLLADFLFVHYDQILTGSALERLSDFLEVRLATSFADETLNRTKARGKIPGKALRIYDTLCGLSGFSET